MSEFRKALAEFGAAARREGERVPVRWSGAEAGEQRGWMRPALALAAVVVCAGVGWYGVTQRDVETAQVDDQVLMRQVSEGLARPVPRALGALMVGYER